jgi:hypothetical protein
MASLSTSQKRMKNLGKAREATETRKRKRESTHSHGHDTTKRIKTKIDDTAPSYNEEEDSEQYSLRDEIISAYKEARQNQKKQNITQDKEHEESMSLAPILTNVFAAISGVAGTVLVTMLSEALKRRLLAYQNGNVEDNSTITDTISTPDDNKDLSGDKPIIIESTPIVEKDQPESEIKSGLFF